MKPVRHQDMKINAHPVAKSCADGMGEAELNIFEA